jgi:hypothetical protein
MIERALISLNTVLRIRESSLRHVVFLGSQPQPIIMSRFCRSTEAQPCEPSPSTYGFEATHFERALQECTFGAEYITHYAL